MANHGYQTLISINLNQYSPLTIGSLNMTNHYKRLQTISINDSKTMALQTITNQPWPSLIMAITNHGFTKYHEAHDQLQ